MTAQFAFDFRFRPPAWVFCNMYDDDPNGTRDEFVRMVERPESEVAVMRRVDPSIVDGVDVGDLYLCIRFRDEENGSVWVMPLNGDKNIAETATLVHGLYRFSGGPERRRRYA